MSSYAKAWSCSSDNDIQEVCSHAWQSSQHIHACANVPFCRHTLQWYRSTLNRFDCCMLSDKLKHETQLYISSVYNQRERDAPDAHRPRLTVILALTLRRPPQKQVRPHCRPRAITTAQPVVKISRRRTPINRSGSSPPHLCSLACPHLHARIRVAIFTGMQQKILNLLLYLVKQLHINQ